jgi:nucleoside-diphosphate-sugar epimerase
VTPVRKVAVAGATGIVGRGFCEHLAGPAGQDVAIVALGRRAPPPQRNLTHVPVDLTRPEGVRAVAPALAGVTELVYAAVSDDPDDVMAGWETPAHSDRNLAMMSSLLDVVESATDRLRHVLVLQGTKAYGTQLGRFTLPARETDPRPILASFYWGQEDHLRARQADRDWHWTILRPTAVIGVAERCQINLLGSVAVYATLLREAGQPLRFPGTSDHLIWQMIDNHLLGEAIDWCLARPSTTNEIFNVANGDATNWESLWPVIADFFAMPIGWPRPLSVRALMRDQQPRWDRIAATHGLANPTMADLVSWEVMDGHMSRNHNSYVSTLEIRRHGFTGFRDSLDTVARKLDLMAEARLIPRY